MIEKKEIDEILKKFAKKGIVKIVGKNEKGETEYIYTETEGSRSE